MLSRTADHLYWMSRYIERAESLARLVDAHYRMSLLPHAGATLAQSLSSTMTALHIGTRLQGKHDAIEPDAVFEFVSLDRDYSGSIYSCLRIARENARAVRGSLTSELWETLNSTWLEARSIVRAPLLAAGHRAVRRVGQGTLPSHPRRHHRHHDARRSLSLHAHRHVSRARRQHRTHSHRAIKSTSCPAPTPASFPTPTNGAYCCVRSPRSRSIGASSAT